MAERYAPEAFESGTLHLGAHAYRVVEIVQRRPLGSQLAQIKIVVHVALQLNEPREQLFDDRLPWTASPARSLISCGSLLDVIQPQRFRHPGRQSTCIGPFRMLRCFSR